MREPETLIVYCVFPFCGRHLDRKFDASRKSFTPSDPLFDTLNIVPSPKLSILNSEGARDANVFSRYFVAAILATILIRVGKVSHHLILYLIL